MNDQQYRKKLREMLTDFYKDVADRGYFEREKETTLKEFNEFLDGWIEKHFPFEMGEKNPLPKRYRGLGLCRINEVKE